jgi:SAM-dependent methyltransferase
MTKVRFDEPIAESYDETSAACTSPSSRPAVGCRGAGGDGAALGTGVGTGRLALPLCARGVRVHGIDISEPMLDQLRRKPGAERIGLTAGDFATTRVEGSFRLAYLAYNTITNLTTQDEQVACFRNAAAHLEPGGRFVIEVFVPALRRLPPGERVRAFHIGRAPSASTSTRTSRVRSCTRTTTGSKMVSSERSRRLTVTSGPRSST